MKNFLLLLSAALFSLTATAQHVDFGLRFGAALASQRIENSNINSTDNIKTWYAAANIELPVKHGFWLQTGLELVNKGGVTYEDAITTTTHLTYLQAPLNIIYKFNMPGLGKWYAGAGGYIGRGVGGHFDYETPNSNTTDKVQFGNQDDFKEFDLGANFVAGLELGNKLTFNVGYSLGLNNIASQPQKDTGTAVIKNRLLTIGLGYLIR